MRKLLFIVTFIFAICFTTFAFAQSRMPQETSNWLQVTGQPGLGTLDSVMVSFFEIPDTATSTLYFAIRHPHLTNSSPDWYGTAGNTTYTLIGGGGALTDAKSRQLMYDATEMTALDHLTGTILDTLIYNTTAPGTTWVYFTGVTPSQGERVGNKYYFKIVIEAAAGIDLKNAFQLDISTVASGTPTGLSGVSTFAYSWNVALLGASNVFNAFPFVPKGDVGDYVVFTNWDFDWDGTTNPTGAAYNKSNALSEASSLGIINPSLQSAPYNTSYLITAGEDDGSWKMKYDEGTDVWINTSEFWTWNSASAINNTAFYDVIPYRLYASHYVPTSPDHISVSAVDNWARDNGNDTETVSFQIVDNTGSPTLKIRDLYVTVTGSAQIDDASNTGTAMPASAVLVTTDADGIAWIDVVNAVNEVIYIAVYTDGTGGSDTLPGTNETTYISFRPTAISALNYITITDLPGGTAVTTNTMTADDTFTVYASGYDSSARFIDIFPVTWGSTGTLDAISDVGVSNITFSPSTAPTSGTITADDLSGNTDTTGTVTVNVGVLVSIKITDTAGGTEITTASITTDTAYTIYASGYDANGNYISLISSTWAQTGTLDAISDVGVTNITFNPTTAGTSGTITADDLGGHTDATGAITVNVGALASIKITGSADGVEITTNIMTTDDTYDLYASGYDADSNYISLISVDWAQTGTIESVVQTATNITFSPTITSSGTITADDLAAHTDVTGLITVNPGALSKFNIAVISDPQQQNIAFNITITAQDAENNTITGFAGTVDLTGPTGMTPATTAAFVSGVRTESITISDVQNNVAITATNSAGAENGVSNTFDIRDTINPVVDAGLDAFTNIQIAQDATVTDAGGIASYLWNQQNGPGTITFGTPTAEDTTIQADVTGAYVIRLTATDNSSNTTYDEMTFTWDTTLPSVDAGIDKLVNVDTSQDATVSDSNGIASYLWTQQSGPGTITFSSAATEDTNIQADTDGVYTIRLTVTDNATNSAFDELTFTWDATDPSVNAGIDQLTNTQISQNATVSDTNGIASYLWTQQFGPGTITSGTDTTEDTTIDADTDGAYVIRLTVTDNAGNTAFDEINFTWDTIDPTVNAGIDKLVSAGALQNATVSDTNGIASYAWTKTSGTGIITFSSAATEDTNIQSDTDGLFVLRLTVTDNAGNSAFDEINFTWDTTDPAVNAGVDQLVNAANLQNATVSDINGIASYAWTKTSGTGTITFGTPTTEDTNISSDTDNPFVIRLTVTDNAGNTAFDEINFTWDTTNPTVDAGTNVLTDVQIAQNATTSDINGIASYAWTKTSGPAVITFGTPTAEDTNVSSSSDGDHVLRLTITDNAGNSAFDEINFTWDTTNPTVDAGTDVLTDVQIAQNATVTDADGVASYFWTQQSGPGTIAFGTATTEDTTIQADTDGAYVIRLTAFDNVGNSAFDEINFTWDTIDPTVNAGIDKLVNITTLQDATTSDTNGIASWTWSKQSGTGTITFGTGSVEDTTISSDTDGLFVIRLTVIDNVGNINFDELNFTWDTTDPAVNAGTDSLTNIQIAQNATVSDINGIASYLWIQQSGPGTITFGSSTTEDTTIQADTDGAYVIRLTVVDNANNTTFDEINFTWDTTDPSVNAGIDQLTEVQITQNATVSDTNGIASYLWTQQSGPGTITFGTATVEDTTIQADTDGAYVIRLTVVDNVGNSAFDEINFIWDTTAPVVNVGIDQVTNALIAQNATVSDANGISSYLWTQQFGIGVITFGTPATEDTTIDADTDGAYVIRLTVTDNAGNTAFDEINFTWDTIDPTVNAGADVLTNIQIAQNATVTDNGGTGIASYAWTQQSGTGTITFGTGSVENTTISSDTDGLFVIRLTVIDNASNTAFDEINFIWDTTAPSVNAGADVLTNILIAQNATVSDANGIAAYLWTQQSGPGIATFGTDFNEDTTIFAGTEGLYVLRLTATDNAGNTAFDEINFTWDMSAPVAPIVSGVTPTSDMTPTWTWDAPAGAVAYRYSFVDGAGWNNTVANSFTQPVALPYGTYTLYVQAKDASNNWSASGSFAIEIMLMADHFTFTTQPIDSIANNPITIVIEARDASDILVTNFNYTVDISDTTGTMDITTATFVDGVFSGTVIITKIQNNVKITVTHQSTSTDSDVFDSIAAKHGIRNNMINPRKGDKVEIYFNVSGSTKVTAVVYNTAGQPVKKIIDRKYSTGEYSFTWDGKNKRRKIVVPGIYHVIVRMGKDRKAYKVLVIK